MHYDYLVVGAGLFGAAFAQRMLETEKSVLVIEKRDHIGGNVFTEEVEGIQIHRYGAHIFHTDSKKAWEYVNRFAEFNRYTNSPIANYHGQLYSLPFNMYTFHKMWDVNTPIEAADIIARQRHDSGILVPTNLEEQAISLVGTDIYEKLIKGYTEKQWGRPCRELPSFIIRRLPVRYTYDNNYFTSRYQGIPIGGYTRMVEKMLSGIEVRLNVDYLEDKAHWDSLADRVVYTGPIDAYFGYCCGPLAYRSVRFETEVLDMPNFQGNAVVNYTDRETPFTRIIEHKHFEFGTQSKTVISREYSQEWEPGMEPYYPVNDEKILLCTNNTVPWQRKNQTSFLAEGWANTVIMTWMQFCSLLWNWQRKRKKERYEAAHCNRTLLQFSGLHGKVYQKSASRREPGTDCDNRRWLQGCNVRNR